MKTDLQQKKAQTEKYFGSKDILSAQLTETSAFRFCCDVTLSPYMILTVSRVTHNKIPPQKQRPSKWYPFLPRLRDAQLEDSTFLISQKSIYLSE